MSCLWNSRYKPSQIQFINKYSITVTCLCDLSSQDHHCSAPTGPDRLRADLNATITARAWRHTAAPVTYCRGGESRAGLSCCKGNNHSYPNLCSDNAAWPASRQSPPCFPAPPACLTCVGFSGDCSLVLISVLLFLKSAEL